MHYTQSIFLLGYTKATIEWLARIALKNKSPDSEEMVGLLEEFEEYFNRQLQAIFNN